MHIYYRLATVTAWAWLPAGWKRQKQNYYMVYYLVKVRDDDV
jgi:hypothetical protein